MFGCYRRSDAADADTYVAAITMVLAHYPADIVKAVTDPYSGLPSRKSESGWSGLPDVAEVKEACEAQATRQARMARYAELPRPAMRQLPPPPKGPGHHANLFVGSDKPGYAEIVQRARTADPADYRYEAGGIWVPLTWHDCGAYTKPRIIDEILTGNLRRDWSELPAEAAE